ncbi:hypothetical protein [Treponema sp. SP13]|uniref:hypothetical protein n=1 Tax=Treponema sp. SP13 TaxID=2789742 RepID=UPI003D8E4D07
MSFPIPTDNFTPPPPRKIAFANTHDYKRLLSACDDLLKKYRHLLCDYYDLLTRCQTVLLKNKDAIDYYRAGFEHPPGANEVSVLYRFGNNNEIRIGKLT